MRHRFEKLFGVAVNTRVHDRDINPSGIVGGRRVFLNWSQSGRVSVQSDAGGLETDDRVNINRLS